MLKKGKAPHFREDDQGTLWYKNRICVPDVKDLRKLIRSEAHDTTYSIHPGSTKMYYDLKERFWWYGMKRLVAEYVAIGDTCQRVKAEHQRPAGLLQPLKIPEWKWEEITMDFIVGLLLTLLSAPICIPQAHGSCSFFLRVFPQGKSYTNRALAVYKSGR